ncbi:hypothetical protein HDU91_000150 [Kappamyces sp. JEL0680]|nr:hypothetical protein HDU91_000150 [Kappamyces sp. JEL0680]
MKRVQNAADYLPESQLERVLRQTWGADWRTQFQEFTMVPFAAASIGQVHRAVLLDGSRVAVKVQYPGVQKSIDSDLDNLVMLLSMGQLLPKGLYLDNTIRVARQELKVECDYVHEADAMIRFASLLASRGLDQHFYVPRVYKELSRQNVLVTEFVEGVTIDRATVLPQEKRDALGSRLLDLCLSELFVFRYMQTDPNWSNFLYDVDQDKINLIDFGAAREFSKPFTDSYLQLLKAGAEKDRDSAIKYSIDLGFLTGLESEAMLAAHTNSLFTLAQPFNAESSDNGVYNFAKAGALTSTVKSDIPVMLRERLKPPPDETYSLHRKLSGCFLLCTKLESRIDCASQFRAYYKNY